MDQITEYWMLVVSMPCSVFVRECMFIKSLKMSEILETYLMQLLSFVSYIEHKFHWGLWSRIAKWIETWATEIWLIYIMNRECFINILEWLPPLLVVASSGDTRQSGSWVYVLEEDGRVFYLVDKEELFISMIYIYSGVHVIVWFLCAGNYPCGGTNSISVVIVVIVVIVVSVKSYCKVV